MIPRLGQGGIQDGALASYVAQYWGTTVYAETIVRRDGDGRILEKTDAVGVVSHDWVYQYDTAGRLTDVAEDGVAESHYEYDVDDNRLSFMSTSGTTYGTYDVQDRLQTYGGATYGYGANGELQSKASGAGTTSYSYDVFGNLLSATLADGTALGYVVDGQNRRVGTLVNGTLTAGYLYQDQLNAVAQLDGNGNLVSRFVFGSKPNVPDYFTNAAGTFRILSDHLGSPRLVVNASNGNVVEEIDYDEFGNVTSDTQPGTIPFGFAGGLYDRSTELVRFGARDYDPIVGRWTSKDPLKLLAGFNVYEYSEDDPINYQDPTGQGPITAGLVEAACQAYALYQLYQTLSGLDKLADQIAELRRKLRSVENVPCDSPDAERAMEDESELEKQIYALTLAYARGQANGEYTFGLQEAACLVLGGIALALPTP